MLFTCTKNLNIHMNSDLQYHCSCWQGHFASNVPPKTQWILTDGNCSPVETCSNINYSNLIYETFSILSPWMIWPLQRCPDRENGKTQQRVWGMHFTNADAKQKLHATPCNPLSRFRRKRHNFTRYTVVLILPQTTINYIVNERMIA